MGTSSLLGTWKSNRRDVMKMFDSFLSTDSMVDVTLACDGKYIMAHKLILSAWSPYFEKLFSLDGNKNPIVFLRGVTYEEMKALVEYMYRGEVNIPQAELQKFLCLGKELMIRGLETFELVAKEFKEPKPVQALPLTAEDDGSDSPDEFPPTPPPPRWPKRKSVEPVSAFRTLEDFDKLPPRHRPLEPNFAYKPEKVIRNKQERKELPGWDCPSCKNYYEGIASQVGPEELAKLKNKCSKHRSRLPEPDFLENTPRYFWDTGFPSTQECLQQGLLRVGTRSPKRPAKTRP